MKVEQIQLSVKRKVDRPILTKLNMVASIVHRNAHDTARYFLVRSLDQFIKDYDSARYKVSGMTVDQFLAEDGIGQSTTQSAAQPMVG